METTIEISNDMLLKAQQVFNMLDVKENTRANYKKDIQAFIQFIKGRTININTFLEFKRELDNRSFSVSTKQKYLSVARTLLKQISKMGYLPTDITVNIKGFKQNKGHKKDGLTEIEMQKLCDNIQLVNDTRLKAILSLLIYQGLRQKEIIGLNAEDLDLKNLSAKILGKGRDEKETIYLHPNTAMAIGNYLNEHKIEGPLFVSNSNNSKGQRLTTKSLRRIVKEVLTNLGINKSTHGFRHYFATNILEKTNGNLELTRDLLRHKGFEMVTTYNDKRLLTNNLPTYYNAFNGVRI